MAESEEPEGVRQRRSERRLEAKRGEQRANKGQTGSKQGVKRGRISDRPGVKCPQVTPKPLSNYPRHNRHNLSQSGDN